MSGPLRLVTWNDIVTDSIIVRIQDDEHYVELPVYHETLVAAVSAREVKRRTLEMLVAEWLSRYGETIYAIEPTQEGTAWTITRTHPDIDGEVISEALEIPARGTLPWDDPNRDIMADIREVLRSDERKAITDR